MNAAKITSTFEKMYPGKKVVKNPGKITTEILCEVEPISSHPDYSVAIAVIDKSVPHSHKISSETYTVIRGTLKLHVNQETVELKRDQSYTVGPGTIHWAEGDETWIECLSRPGWTQGDHIPASPGAKSK
jgi:mannose-6-phosphate isomerase-like protein (cupin superfamily)